MGIRFSSANLQRGDSVIGEREGVVELNGAAGKIARQASAEPHELITHRCIQRLQNILILCVRLALPGANGIDAAVVMAFIMYHGVVGEARSESVRILCFFGGEITFDWSG